MKFIPHENHDTVYIQIAEEVSQREQETVGKSAIERSEWELRVWESVFEGLHGCRQADGYRAIHAMISGKNVHLWEQYVLKKTLKWTHCIVGLVAPSVLMRVRRFGS